MGSLILSSLSSPLLLRSNKCDKCDKENKCDKCDKHASSVVKIQSYQGNQYDWVSISGSTHSSVQLVKSIFRVNLSNWMGVPVFQDSQFCFFSSFSKIVIFFVFPDFCSFSFSRFSGSWILLPQVLFLGLPLSALWQNEFCPLLPEFKNLPFGQELKKYPTRFCLCSLANEFGLMRPYRRTIHSGKSTI